MNVIAQIRGRLRVCTFVRQTKTRMLVTVRYGSTGSIEQTWVRKASRAEVLEGGRTKIGCWDQGFVIPEAA